MIIAQGECTACGNTHPYAQHPSSHEESRMIIAQGECTACGNTHPMRNILHQLQQIDRPASRGMTCAGGGGGIQRCRGCEQREDPHRWQHQYDDAAESQVPAWHAGDHEWRSYCNHWGGTSRPCTCVGSMPGGVALSKHARRSNIHLLVALLGGLGNCTHMPREALQLKAKKKAYGWWHQGRIIAVYPARQACCGALTSELGSHQLGSRCESGVQCGQ
jgi:hypothetical protein